MSFHDVRLPLKFAFGSTGGPTRRTDVVTLASGAEHRNATWADSRRRWDASTAVKSLHDMDLLLHFFEARRGKLHGFRFRDPFDWQSCGSIATVSPLDQAIGTGTGSAQQLQLVKAYTSGGETYSRRITRPVAGTVRVAVAGVETTSFTVDAATGIVSLTATNGAAVTAGFEFDVPVRFDTDELFFSLEAFEAGSLPQVPIVELRE